MCRYISFYINRRSHNILYPHIREAEPGKGIREFIFLIKLKFIYKMKEMIVFVKLRLTFYTVIDLILIFMC